MAEVEILSVEIPSRVCMATREGLQGSLGLFRASPLHAPRIDPARTTHRIRGMGLWKV